LNEREAEYSGVCRVIPLARLQKLRGDACSALGHQELVLNA